MEKMFKDLSEVDGVIEALRISNQELTKLIDDLITKSVKKDNKIKTLEQQLGQAKFVIDVLGNN